METIFDDQISNSVDPDFNKKGIGSRHIENTTVDRQQVLTKGVDKLSYCRPADPPLNTRRNADPILIPSVPRPQQLTIKPDYSMVNIPDDVFTHSIVPSLQHSKEVLSQNAYFLAKWDSQGPSSLLSHFLSNIILLALQQTLYSTLEAAASPLLVNAHENDENDAGFERASLAGGPEMGEEISENITLENHHRAQVLT